MFTLNEMAYPYSKTQAVNKVSMHFSNAVFQSPNGKCASSLTASHKMLKGTLAYQLLRANKKKMFKNLNTGRMKCVQ